MIRTLFLALPALVLSLSLSLMGQSIAQSTTGLRSGGYTYVSDVLGYLNMTSDICDIHHALMSGDKAMAIDIFANGKNSIRGAGLRSYSLWALTNHSAEASYKAIMAGRPDDYFVKKFAEHVNASDMAGAMAIIDAVQIKYLLHELEEAAVKTSKNTTSDAAGSPHNLDEAWGIWDGRNGLCGATMFEKAETLAQSLGLMFDGRAVLNTAAAVNFGDALWAARRNNTNAQLEASGSLVEQIHVYLMQAIHANAYTAALIDSSGVCPNKTQANRAIKAPLSTIAVSLDLLTRLAKAADNNAVTALALSDLAKASKARPFRYQTMQKALVKLVEGLGNATDIEPWHLGTAVRSRFTISCDTHSRMGRKLMARPARR